MGLALSVFLVFLVYINFCDKIYSVCLFVSALGLEDTVGNFEVSNLYNYIHDCTMNQIKCAHTFHAGWKAVWCPPGRHPGPWCIKPSFLHFSPGLYGSKSSCRHTTIPCNCSIRRHGYYLFQRAILCNFYLRVVFIKLSVIGKIFGNCKGFEKRQFYKNDEKLQCGDLVLKQTFQLDQPALCFKAVPTRNLQSVPSIFFQWDRPPCLKKCQTSLNSMHSC